MKKLVGINLSPEVIDYFKKLADDSQIPYQKLIDLYLLDCVKSKKKVSLKWVAYPKFPQSVNYGHFSIIPTNFPMVLKFFSTIPIGLLIHFSRTKIIGKIRVPAL